LVEAEAEKTDCVERYLQFASIEGGAMSKHIGIVALYFGLVTLVVSLFLYDTHRSVSSVLLVVVGVCWITAFVYLMQQDEDQQPLSDIREGSAPELNSILHLLTVLFMILLFCLHAIIMNYFPPFALLPSLLLLLSMLAIPLSLRHILLTFAGLAELVLITAYALSASSPLPEYEPTLSANASALLEVLCPALVLPIVAGFSAGLLRGRNAGLRWWGGTLIWFSGIAATGAVMRSDSTALIMLLYSTIPPCIAFIWMVIATRKTHTVTSSQDDIPD
jgi:hypothetical protein